MMRRASSEREKDRQEAIIDRKLESTLAAVNRRFDDLYCSIIASEHRVVDVLGQLQRQLRDLETSQSELVRRTSSVGAAAGTSLVAPCFLAAPPAGKTPESARKLAAAVAQQRGMPGERTPLLSDREDDGVGGNGAGRAVDEDHRTFQEKLAAAQAAMEASKVKQSPLAKAVLDFLEDPDSGPAAAAYEIFMTAYNVIAILIAMLNCLDVPLFGPHGKYDHLVAFWIDFFLVLEVIIRCASSPSWFGAITNPMNLIDASSVLPLIVAEMQDHVEAGLQIYAANFCLVGVPFIRLLRMVRRFPAFQLLISAFKTCLEALPVLLYTMAIIAVFFSAMIFIFEPRDNMATMSTSAWLVLSTMTTVGYGDVVPETQEGIILCSLLMVTSSLYMAMPVAIIGYQFTAIWGNRSQILLLHRTRDRLAKWGFGPYEIPRLFKLFDLDDSAEIELDEFTRLLQQMEVGFRDDDITELFKAIDKDSGGSIDTKEFIKTLYPDEYRVMFGKKKQDGGGDGKAEEAVHALASGL